MSTGRCLLAQPEQVVSKDLFHVSVKLDYESQFIIGVAVGKLMHRRDHGAEHRSHCAGGLGHRKVNDDPSAVNGVPLPADEPGFSSRSTTPVMDAVVNPVALASSPAVISPLKLRMFRQLRSVELTPIRSAAAWLINCISEPVLRIPAANSRASLARSGLHCLSPTSAGQGT